eukprot:1141837-Pelagomonas_calceolata.AAC.2
MHMHLQQVGLSDLLLHQEMAEAEAANVQKMKPAVGLGRQRAGTQQASKVGSSANCSPVPRAARAGDREGLALQVGKLPQGACCSCFSSSKGMRPASTAAQRHQAQGDPGTD